MSSIITTSPASSSLPPSRAPQAALGRHTAAGFAWTMAQAIATKGAGIVSQIAMAWFLTPNDFKLVGLTYAVSSFPNLIRDAGLQTILVNRQQHLRRWIGPVFWLSAILGLFAGLAMAAAAPIAARVYAQPQLAGLLRVIAIGAFVGSLGAVPNAIVQIQLRFRLQALLALATALLTLGLNVLMARRGWGAYSYIIPLALVNGIRTAALWAAAPNPVPLRLHVRRWRFVIGDSGILVLAGIVGTAISQGDYLTMGVFHRHDDAVGIFFFAFSLSMQTVTILTFNIGAVLFPVLSRFQSDRPRQIQAYIRTARVLALVGIPACFLQAALCNPGFHLVFKPKWYPAITVTEVLSLAMAVRVVGITWLTLTAAQGRFKMQLVLMSGFCALFLGSVAIASKFGGAVTVAITETVFFAIADPLAMYVVLKASGAKPLVELRRIFLIPILAAAVAAAAGHYAGMAVPTFRGAIIAQMTLITLTTAAVYLPLIRALAPADFEDMLSPARSAMARFMGAK